MRLNTIKKTVEQTSAANLEEKFNAGEDISDYFDFSRPVIWGGARAGSGRKRLGKVRKQILLSPDIVAKVNALAAKKHLSFSATVESACASMR